MKWLSLLTPRYWLRRRQRIQVDFEANSLLPRPYDFALTIFELRHTRMDPEHSEGFPTAPEGEVSADHVLRSAAARALEERRAESVAAGAAGLVVGQDYLQAFAAVDDGVLGAASDLFHRKLESIGDLSHALDGRTLGEGLSNALKGRMGEHILADRLTELGVDAVLAPNPNQEGWDLTIDGVKVNPKVYADASATAEHFERFPDVPVILPADAANLPSDALHFDSLSGEGLDSLREALAKGSEHLSFVDDALSHSELSSQASDALGVTGDPGAVVDVHFPWVAVALSGWREVRLLRNGHTQLGTSVKNISLDAGGTGIGGIAGAKAGALVGSLLGPVGTGIGAFIGAATGAFLGRIGSRHLKEAGLRASSDRFFGARASLREELRRENARISLRVETQRRTEQVELDREVLEAREHVERACAHVREARERARAFSGEEAETLLAAAQRVLDGLEEGLAERRAVRSWWRRHVWPDVSLLSCERASEVIAALALRVGRWRTLLEGGGTLSRADVYSCLGQFGLVEHEVRTALAALEREERSRVNAVRTGMRKTTEGLLSARRAAVQRINDVIEQSLQGAQTALTPYVSRVSGARTEVEIEARRLGYSV
jgi:gas vesicle protein